MKGVYMSTVYLAGAIEYSPDKGIKWRQEIEDFYEKHLPGKCNIINPNKVEKTFLTQEDKNYLMSSNPKGDIVKYQSVVRKFIEHDLVFVEESDYLICLWDEHVNRGSGTQGEITYAYKIGRPVYYIVTIPIEQMSGWAIGCGTKFFTSIKEFGEFIILKHSE